MPFEGRGSTHCPQLQPAESMTIHPCQILCDLHIGAFHLCTSASVQNHFAPFQPRVPFDSLQLRQLHLFDLELLDVISLKNRQLFLNPKDFPMDFPKDFLPRTHHLPRITTASRTDIRRVACVRSPPGAEDPRCVAARCQPGSCPWGVAERLGATGGPKIHSET